VGQIDLTGSFQTLSRIPNSNYRHYGKDASPDIVRAVRIVLARPAGLVL
jgi:hypothetical protein